MDDTTPPGSNISGAPSPGGSEWRIGVRPQCYHCDRLAVTHGPDDRALCARHARLYLTPRPLTEG